VTGQQQDAFRTSLAAMFRQLRTDSYYEDIGASLKYKPPFDLKDRDDLIEKRKGSMGKLISQMMFSYNSLKDYTS
jgi:hypothetical protein